MSRRLNRFLIVDKAEARARQTACLGKNLGYTTLPLTDLRQFQAALADFDPTFVLIDLQSVSGDGLEYLESMRGCATHAQVMLTDDAGSTALGTAKQLAEFLGLPTVATSRSPVFASLLCNELRKALQPQTGLARSDPHRAGRQFLAASTLTASRGGGISRSA